jgi:hypothetical protein
MEAMRQEAEAIEMARRAHMAELERKSQQDILRFEREMAAQAARSGPTPVTSAVPRAQQPVVQNVVSPAPQTGGVITGTPNATTPIKPYVAGGGTAPVKQWDAINKNAENPGIKPYVVVPRSQQSDEPKAP